MAVCDTRGVGANSQRHRPGVHRESDAWLVDRGGGGKTLFIEPGSQWKNGYVESFNGKLREELLNSENVYTLQKAKLIIEACRPHDNHVRSHSSLRNRSPAPARIIGNLRPLLVPGTNREERSFRLDRLGGGKFWRAPELRHRAIQSCGSTS